MRAAEKRTSLNESEHTRVELKFAEVRRWPHKRRLREAVRNHLGASPDIVAHLRSIQSKDGKAAALTPSPSLDTLLQGSSETCGSNENK
eukprot:4718367-Pleurochrysis_carterae.AAC.2